MSTGKATTLSAFSFSRGTNSWSGSGGVVAGGVAAGADAEGGGVSSVGAWSGRAGAEPALARSAAVSRTRETRLIAFPFSFCIAGDAKAHVGPRLRRVVAVGEPELAHRAVEEARAEDDVEVAC